MLLHGAGRMIQAAFTYYFVLGPIILFTIDQLISVSRRKIEIPVVDAKLLPSGSQSADYHIVVVVIIIFIIISVRNGWSEGGIFSSRCIYVHDSGILGQTEYYNSGIYVLYAVIIVCVKKS